MCLGFESCLGSNDYCITAYVVLSINFVNNGAVHISESRRRCTEKHLVTVVLNIKYTLRTIVSAKKGAGVVLLTRSYGFTTIVHNQYRRHCNIEGSFLSRMAYGPPRAGVPSVLTGRSVRLHLHIMALVPHVHVSQRCSKHSHCTLHREGLVPIRVARLCLLWSRLQNTCTTDLP